MIHPFNLLYLSLLIPSSLPLPVPFTLHPRDADFETVRTNLLVSNHDLSSPSSSQKYFHESIFDGHHDGRFASARTNPHTRHIHLTALIRSYLSFTTSIGAETWLMHGTLLGWYWNRAILPWDSDVDVMTSEKSMRFLAGYHNMTVHTFEFEEAGGGNQRDSGTGMEMSKGNGNGNAGGSGGKEKKKKTIRSYLLEINPNCFNSSLDPSNKIDARWIDRDTGLFIDITTVRRNLTARGLGDEDALMVKDGHHYFYDDIWPLREAMFEGVPVKIPYAYPEILSEEYGVEALARERFQEHRFDVGRGRYGEWVSRFEAGEGEKWRVGREGDG